MKLPTNLGLKAYLIIFTAFALSSFMALLSPSSTTSMYYKSMIIFFDAAVIWYMFAVLDASLSCLAAIPLSLRAYDQPARWAHLFQWLFILRVASIFTGHRYEYIVLKSALIGTPTLGFIALTVWMLFVFPSFKEHYLYAFRSKK